MAKNLKRGLFISAVCLLLAVAFIVPGVRGHIESLAHTIAGRTIVYFNDMVQDDDIRGNEYNFGPDRKAWAEDAIAAGNATTVLDFVIGENQDGDFFESIEKDPALCAAIALHIDNTLAVPELILIDEQDVQIGQRADAAHLHFLKDEEYWNRAVSMIKDYLGKMDVKIVHLSNYTSAMYQWHNGLEGNKPSVIVRNTTNSGGDMVTFTDEKLGTVKFRLQCGYQPVDIDYWPTPDVPPIPDNPEPEPDEPELEPKDPNAGPQAQGKDQPGYEDFGGGQNHDNDTTLTEEPKSPDSYTAPEPPKAEETKKDDTSNKKPADGSTGTQSGSKTVDEDNGKTESKNGKDYEVVAGDGEQHSDLNKVQEEQHNSSTVEEPLKDDGVNQGDLDPANIE